MRKFPPLAYMLLLALLLLAVYGAQYRGFLGAGQASVILGLSAFAFILWRRPDLSHSSLYRTVLRVSKAKALMIGACLFFGSFVWLAASIVVIRDGYIAMVPFVVLCTVGTFICVGVAVLKLFELVSKR
jgi:hypothetical protein